jgi:HlyD family secretion protein
VAAVGVAALAGGWALWRARAGSDAPRYRTAAVERGDIEAKVSATGTLRPVHQVEVGSQVSGTVYRIHADYNSRVRAGQVLCEIEPSSFRARVVQNQAAVTKAEVAVKDAQRVLTRARELFKQNYIAQAEVEAAEVALEQRQAELSQARAQLQVAQVDLDHTVIRAPIDGVVIARSIDLGQTVAASLQAPQLFVIANDLARMQVETRIDEADIGRILPGLPVTFSVDAYPDMTFEGQVAQVRLEPIVEQGVVTYTTVILTGNPGLRLKPGMTANVAVLAAKREDVVKVPSAALRFRPPAPEGGGAAMAAVARNGPERSAPVGAGQARVAAGDSVRPGARPRFAAGDSARGRAGGGRGRMGAGRGAGAAARGSAGRGLAAAEEAGLEAPEYRPGVVHRLRGGRPERVPVMTGLSDGAFVEVRSDRLQVGDQVIVGLEAESPAANLQPPPGMGGPRFGGGGGRGRR